MLKGGQFYAVLDNETNMWSTHELDVFKKIDDKLYSKRESIGSEDGYGIWRTKDGDEIVLNTLNDSKSKELKSLKNRYDYEKDYNERYIKKLKYVIDEKDVDYWNTKKCSIFVGFKKIY